MSGEGLHHLSPPLGGDRHEGHHVLCDPQEHEEDQLRLGGLWAGEIIFISELFYLS